MKEITQVWAHEIKTLLPEFLRIILENRKENEAETRKVIEKWLEQKDFEPAKKNAVRWLLANYQQDANLRTIMGRVSCIKFYDDGSLTLVSEDGTIAQHVVFSGGLSILQH